MTKMAPITNKEKIMLIFVGLALVIALLYLFVGRPMITAMSDKKTKIDTMTETYNDMKDKANGLATTQATLKKVDEKLNDAKTKFYSSMEAWKVEKVVTDVVVGNGVSVSSSVITQEIALKTSSDTTSSETTDTNATNNTGTNSGTTPPNAVMSKIPGIYTRTVSITFTGSPDNVKSMLNAFANSDKKLAITDFTYSLDDKNNCSGSFNVILFMIKD